MDQKTRGVYEGIKSFYRTHQTYPTSSALARELKVTRQQVDYIVRRYLIPEGLVEVKETEEERYYYTKRKHVGKFKRLILKNETAKGV